MLLLHGAWVQSPGGELRSLMPVIQSKKNKKQVLPCWGLLWCGLPPPHSLFCCYRVMLDSVTHSTFLPNTSFCDPLMSWTDLFSNEEYYPAFEHQTGVYDWRSPSELGQVGQEVALASGGRQGHESLKRPALTSVQDRGLPESGAGRRATSAQKKALESSLQPLPSSLCGLGKLH